MCEVVNRWEWLDDPANRPRHGRCHHCARALRRDWCLCGDCLKHFVDLMFAGLTVDDDAAAAGVANA
jgi:hypothetical protein